jgi:hypothetical protein
MSDEDQFDRFEAWFNKEYPISGDRGRIKYRESSVRDLMIAAWQASRRTALEEAWQICNVNAAKLKGPKETASGYVALVLTADEIRSLANEDAARTGDSDRE